MNFLFRRRWTLRDFRRSRRCGDDANAIDLGEALNDSQAHHPPVADPCVRYEQAWVAGRVPKTTRASRLYPQRLVADTGKLALCRVAGHRQPGQRYVAKICSPATQARPCPNTMLLDQRPAAISGWPASRRRWPRT